MKRIITLLAIFTLCVISAYAQDWSQRERKIIGNIVNSVTGAAVADTVKAEILMPDSSVIAYAYSKPDYRWQYSDADERKYFVELIFKAPGEDFLIRVSHPEYATEYFPVKLNTFQTDAGNLAIRKLTQFEKNLMLGEVTVRASVIQVVNKGDTLQYNADAFAVAEGSMLDALVEQLPGVELRDNGRIYVNNRFVDKLLLDGKDFFKNDQFVLLQNLPAYTVKNIKVYEQASASSEVFGKGKNPNDPDKYVMDITLKKGYNTGWMANAEAGGGTHDRYRGRAFGVGFSKTFRLGAFGFANNLNESRNPGRNGDWSPADGMTGLTTTQGGGLSYGYFASDRSIELTGSASAQHAKTRNNSVINTQNFLEGGDTYTRRWNDNTSRKLALSTDHQLTLRPKSGNSYNQSFYLTVNYSDDKTQGNTTEGTFGNTIGDVTDLKEKLRNGWISNLGAINRYLSESAAGIKSFNAHLTTFTTLSVHNKSNGLRLIASGSYKNISAGQPNYNNYLLQYNGDSPSVVNRSNPVNSHGYDFNMALDFMHNLSSYVSFSPRVDYFQIYNYNNNRWLTDAVSADTTFNNRGSLLPSVRQEAMMRLDPANSYVTGSYIYAVRPRLPIVYSRSTMRDGQEDSYISTGAQVELTYTWNHIRFTGLTNTFAEKNYFKPKLSVWFTKYFSRMHHYTSLSYYLGASDIEIFDMLDIKLDSDPLNPRMGNPDLKIPLSHMFQLGYSSQYWIWNHLWLNVDADYNIHQRMVAMSYAYDRNKGVRTYRPVNINGNRDGKFSIAPTVALDRDKKWRFSDNTSIQHLRSADMVSYDNFASSQKSIVNNFILSESASLQYSVSKFMIAADSKVNYRRVSSGNGYFDPFHVTEFNYGLRGRVSLPAGFEISTDIKMYSTRGFDYSEMNTNQLVWNGRVTKTLCKGKLLMALDGYDILGKVKSISYNVNEQGRTETWVNSIPSYVMLSLRWNFAKKPRE